MKTHWLSRRRILEHVYVLKSCTDLFLGNGCRNLFLSFAITVRSAGSRYCHTCRHMPYWTGISKCWKEHCVVIIQYGHLFKLGLSNSPTCERCQERNETATHILCECEALACLRLRHLGQYFMEPSDYFDVPTYKILRFIRSAGLLRG
jgi:hypothetical protein